MFGIVVAGIVAAWMTVYLIPDLVWHHLQWGAVFGSREHHQIALTFDDGPGPDTPDILRVLREHNARATFFVVAERAQHYPEMLKEMVAGGHEIGLHGYQHRSMYLFWPWSAAREIRRGLDTIEAITGTRPVSYRPPWGHHNVMTGMMAHRLGLRRVLWSIAPDDWKSGKTPEMIEHYVVQLSHPGSIVVMHDGGGDRRNTVQALGPIIDKVRELGLHPVSTSELENDHSEFRRWWTWWETRFTRQWDIDTIPSSLGGDPVLRLGHIKYPFKTVVLSTGKKVTRSQPMGEIHFGNPALSQLSSSRAGGLRAFHAVLRSLSDLAGFVARSEKYQDIVVVGGITLLDASSAIEKLGFERMSVSGSRKWSMWIYLIVLMAIYHADGWHALKRFLRLKPVLLLMDRETLMERYLRSSNPRRA
ncbi:MAG: polysaccharide deacetylase family protein [Firmicutes bacterium]|jgi:peptidoglycan/xylan/chitin deacetylase (PgdA/CDA1 family)|uniref:Polysaccharide deacetylase family protein n=1 Tax=Sulfobacillus benefaciens TaxID=453960 RepID=A0A2T2X2Z2_9FIRM|nr:polysaccharide deacetylase family protein [Bacillota bacterium]MCL5014543.1 polysaccharide deacetylase family protein [Bacillota bacterium]PSR28870.1 MAG: polysaccharide deacetylase family protein [Sulfobacillus benefaciens]HBQ96678.1 polysaccharide deacetylase family protein [Sulfobacillus sp.]